jgi:hypothetical protein
MEKSRNAYRLNGVRRRFSRRRRHEAALVSAMRGSAAPSDGSDKVAFLPTTVTSNQFVPEASWRKINFLIIIFNGSQ